MGVDFGGGAVDVEDGLVLARVPPLGVPLHQVIPDRQDDVSLGQSAQISRRRAQAHGRLSQFVTIVQGALAHEGWNHPQAKTTGKRTQPFGRGIAGRLAADHAVAGENDRVLGRT